MKTSGEILADLYQARNELYRRQTTTLTQRGEAGSYVDGIQDGIELIESVIENARLAK